MKLLVADDHALFRVAVGHILRELGPETQVVQADCLTRALEVAGHTRDFDLALLDLKMPDVKGIESVHAFRELIPELPIVVLSASEDCDDIEACLDAGAMGFIPKSSPAAVLLGALRLVLEGGVYLPPQLLGRVAENRQESVELTMRRQLSELYPQLTHWQIGILACMKQGKSNKEIARRLDLSERAIRSNLTTIYRTLGVRNRTEAVLALQRAAVNSKLTEQQAEILQLVQLGKSNKEISKDLGLSEGAIKIHLAALFRALGARNLTERQAEILQLVQLGKSNKDISRDLGLSEGTIKIHLVALFRALGARNRTEAVLLSQRFLANK